MASAKFVHGLDGLAFDTGGAVCSEGQYLYESECSITHDYPGVAWCSVRDSDSVMVLLEDLVFQNEKGRFQRPLDPLKTNKGN